jgi:hypothetical protein
MRDKADQADAGRDEVHSERAQPQAVSDVLQMPTRICRSKDSQDQDEIRYDVEPNSVATSRASRQGMRYEALPITNLPEGIVGWESQEDPGMPFNFPAWRKWTWIGLLSIITLLTPFASSILSPAISTLLSEFQETSAIVGSLTVSIYLFGYVIGPVFIAPLSEIYGRKHVLGISNAFFCSWQVGCAAAPNVAALIVFRFLSGVGGAACLVSHLRVSPCMSSSGLVIFQTLGGSIIGDLFRPDTRAFAMGMWNIGPLLGKS